MRQRRLARRVEQYPPAAPRSAESLRLPHRPQPFFEKLRANSALKRSSRFEVSLSELEDCISAHSLDEQLAAGELSAQINAFLAALRRDDRVMFVRRYWFAQPLSEIADAFGTTENNVSVRLGRIRRKLHTYLERKEVTL